MLTKNNNLRIITLIFFLFLYHLGMTKAIAEISFNFNVTEIEIDPESEKIKGKKRGIITSNNGDQIEADEFIYDKSTNILVLKGNVIFKDLNETLINSDELIYNKTEDKLLAKGNSIINIQKDYNIFADEIIYFKKKDLIETKGRTKAEIKNNYLIESEDIIFLKKMMVLESNKKTKFYDNKNDIFLSLEKFSYSLNLEELKGEKIILVKDYKKPNNEKFFLENAFINLKDNSFLTGKIKLELKKDTFGNPDNDPRLVGASSKSKNGVTVINKGKFTSCKKTDDCVPWSIQASKITHDNNKKQITYDNAALKLYDQTVFYFPKFFHPDPSVKRQSGFLAPNFNNSKTLGSSINIPYFYVLSDNKDLTFSPTLFDKDTKMLQTEFRREGKNSSLITDFNYINNYKSNLNNEKNTISHFFSKFNSNLNLKNFESSTFNLDFFSVNNDTYLKVFENHLSKSELKPDNLDVLSSRAEIALEHQNFSFTTGFNSYEDLKKSKSDRYEFVLPYYNFSSQINENQFGIINFISSGDNILKDTNNFRSRMINDINLESFNLISDSGLKNSINFITKNIITTGNEHNEHDSSAEIKLMGLIEAETSLPLISRGDKFTNFLSPKVSIRYNPSNMQDYSSENRKIFNNNLFETNRLGLVDTLESGKSLTLGFEYRKENIDNINKYFEFNLGKVFRDEEINEIPITSTLNKKESNLIGSLRNNLNENITFSYDFSVNNKYNELEYSSIGTSLSVNNFVTTFNYIEENNNIGSAHAIENTTSYNFNEGNSILFRTRQNRETDITEYYDLIYEYKNDCLVAGIGYNKSYYTDRELKPTEELMFSIKIIPLTTFNQSVGQ